MNQTFYIAFIIPALLSFIFTYPVIKFAKRWGIVDDPKKNKHPKVTHTYPVPRGGGLAIYLSLVISAFIFLPLDQHLIGIILGATILLIVGLLDDKYNLNPYLRLGTQFLAASLPIMAGIGIAYTTNPFNGVINLSQPQLNFYLFGETRSIWILSDLFALFWIVTLINFINMGAKGVDGQLPGVAAIAAFTLAVLSLRFSADITEWPVIILALITAGVFVGFLPWNMYPQKIMPSFSGSNLAGYTLGILSILTTAKIGTLLLVLGIPLIDTSFTVIRRLSHGKSPVWGDRGHLHHKLLDAGFPRKSIAPIYWLFTAILGIGALYLNATSKLYTILGISLLLAGILLWLTYRQKH